MLPHRGEDGEPIWAHRQLVESLHENWPEVLERHRLPSILAVSEWSPEDTRALRRAGVSPYLQIDGAVYASPGGGLVTSGDSLRSVQDA